MYWRSFASTHRRRPPCSSRRDEKNKPQLFRGSDRVLWRQLAKIFIPYLAWLACRSGLLPARSPGSRGPHQQVPKSEVTATMHVLRAGSECALDRDRTSGTSDTHATMPCLRDAGRRDPVPPGFGDDRDGTPTVQSDSQYFRVGRAASRRIGRASLTSRTGSLSHIRHRAPARARNANLGRSMRTPMRPKHGRSVA